MRVTFNFTRGEAEEHFIKDFLKMFLLNQKYNVIEVKFILEVNMVKLEDTIEEANKKIKIETKRNFRDDDCSKDKVLRMLGLSQKNFIKPTEKDIDYLLEEFIHMKNRKIRLLDSIHDEFFDLIKIEIFYLLE